MADADVIAPARAGLFSKEEYDTRLAAVRRAMAAQDVAFLLLSAPENIFYLTGLDHWGYFAPHILVVPAAGEMLLVARAMERVTVTNQVHNALFEGHRDSETAADAIARALSGGRFAHEPDRHRGLVRRAASWPGRGVAATLPQRPMGRSVGPRR